MEWINVNDLIPNDNFNEPEKEYHLIYVKGYGSMKAMYMDGEWWKDYTSKICKNVTHWMKITNPSDKKTKPEINLDEYGWEGIFGKAIQEIEEMQGDIECGYAADIMLDMIENYFLPMPKPDMHPKSKGDS